MLSYNSKADFSKVWEAIRAVSLRMSANHRHVLNSRHTFSYGHTPFVAKSVPDLGDEFLVDVVTEKQIISPFSIN